MGIITYNTLKCYIVFDNRLTKKYQHTYRLTSAMYTGIFVVYYVDDLYVFFILYKFKTYTTEPKSNQFPNVL